MNWTLAVGTLFASQLLISSQGLAFDRIVCDSNLGSWTVHNSLDSKKEVLSKLNPSLTLNKAESITLMLRDEKMREVAFISPWNEIQFHKAKKSNQPSLNFDFKTDKETWFTLSVKDTTKKVSRSLSCKMTF